MSHLQSELAETKVGLLMVKAEEAAEKDATDVLIRTILSIVSVGEMTETRHSAVEALTAIKASRATREDWKKDTANTPPREKRRGSPASTPTRGSPRAASLKSDWAPGGGVSSPSNGRGGGGPPVRYSTGTHNIDVQITEERAQPSGEVEYALDVFEIGRDFITRSWHTYAECSDLLAMLRGVASDDGWVSGSEGLLPSVATPQLSRQTVRFWLTPRCFCVQAVAAGGPHARAAAPRLLRLRGALVPGGGSYHAGRLPRCAPLVVPPCSGCSHAGAVLAFAQVLAARRGARAHRIAPAAGTEPACCFASCVMHSVHSPSVQRGLGFINKLLAHMAHGMIPQTLTQNPIQPTQPSPTQIASWLQVPLALLSDGPGSSANCRWPLAAR